MSSAYARCREKIWRQIPLRATSKTHDKELSGTLCVESVGTGLSFLEGGEIRGEPRIAVENGAGELLSAESSGFAEVSASQIGTLQDGPGEVTSFGSRDITRIGVLKLCSTDVGSGQFGPD